jgi:hypothetical protein
MDIKLVVAATGMEDERIASATRELLKEIRVDADPSAKLAAGVSDTTAKGDLVTFSQIALALVTGGAITKLIESLFGFLGRNRKFEVEVQNAAGEKLKLNLDFVDRHGAKDASALVKRFLTAK